MYDISLRTQGGCWDEEDNGRHFSYEEEDTFVDEGDDKGKKQTEARKKKEKEGERRIRKPIYKS